MKLRLTSFHRGWGEEIQGSSTARGERRCSAQTDSPCTWGSWRTDRGDRKHLWDDSYSAGTSTGQVSAKTEPGSPLVSSHLYRLSAPGCLITRWFRDLEGRERCHSDPAQTRRHADWHSQITQTGLRRSCCENSSVILLLFRHLFSLRTCLMLFNDWYSQITQTGRQRCCWENSTLYLFSVCTLCCPMLGLFTCYHLEGGEYRYIIAGTDRLRNSFYLPAIRLLNSHH